MGVQAERQKHRKRVSHSSVQRAVFGLLEVACSLDAFCPASGPVLLPLLLLPRSIFLTLAPSLPLVHPHHSPASLALFSLYPLFLPKAEDSCVPLREKCVKMHNAGPPACPPPAQSVRRGPCIWCLTDQIFCQIAGPFLFPAARRERCQKWCGRRGEGTVIVSRSVEIPQPTHPPNPPPPTPSSPKPLLNRFSVKRKSVPGQQEATSLQNNQKTVCTHIWITFNLSHESPYIEYNTLHCPQFHLFFNTPDEKKRRERKAEFNSQSHFWIVLCQVRAVNTDFFFVKLQQQPLHICGWEQGFYTSCTRARVSPASWRHFLRCCLYCHAVEISKGAPSLIPANLTSIPAVTGNDQRAQKNNLDNSCSKYRRSTTHNNSAGTQQWIQDSVTLLP